MVYRVAHSIMLIFNLKVAEVSNLETPVTYFMIVELLIYYNRLNYFIYVDREIFQISFCNDIATEVGNLDKT